MEHGYLWRNLYMSILSLIEDSMQAHVCSFSSFPPVDMKKLTLTNAPHMTLWHSHPLIPSHTETSHSDDNELYVHVDGTGKDNVSPTQPIPTKTTDGAQVYCLQKAGGRTTRTMLNSSIPHEWNTSINKGSFTMSQGDGDTRCICNRFSSLAYV